MLKLEVLTTYGELELVRDLWSSQVVYPTADLDLFVHICQSRHDVLCPYVLAVKSDEQIVTLLIGRIETHRQVLRLAYLRTKGPRLRSLAFIHGGKLGDWNLDITSLILKKIIDILGEKQVDLVNFSYLPEDDLFVEMAQVLFRTNRYAHLLSKSQTHWLMNIDQSGQDYLKHLTRKSRYNLRRERRKFELEFGESINFRSFQEPGEFRNCIRDIESIASQSYHRSLGVGFEATTETLQRMEIEARRGRLLAYVLYVHDIPIAFWIGVLSNHIFFADYTGYLTTYSEHEPGKATLFSLIEFLSENTSTKIIDFGFGDAFYKRQLGSRSWEEVNMTAYGRTLAGTMAFALESALANTDKLLRQLALRTNTLSKLKSAWRRNLRTRHNSSNSEH